MEHFSILDFMILFAAVISVCFSGFVLSISSYNIFKRFRKPKSQSRKNIQIDHISRVYETAKDGVYRADMKAALDGLQELRNIACEQTVLNDKHSSI